MLKVLKEETEEQLKILKEREIELSEANQKKHKLMRMLSHDFKNPLSGIMGLITILLEDDSLEEDERTEMLELIKSGSEKLLELVKDLLDKEIVGSNFGTLNLEETDIVAFANEVVQNNRAKAALKKIKMNFMSDWDELMLNIDRDKMYYALNTLISNAVKFTISEGQVSVQLTRSKQGSLIVKVKDNGIGIPNSMLPNFLISSHKDQAKNPKGILGIGLGLEEVQSYVDAHEGIIWVESEENKGTTFFIELQLGN